MAGLPSRSLSKKICWLSAEKIGATMAALLARCSHSESSRRVSRSRIKMWGAARFWLAPTKTDVLVLHPKCANWLVRATSLSVFWSGEHSRMACNCVGSSGKFRYRTVRPFADQRGAIFPDACSRASLPALGHLVDLARAQVAQRNLIERGAVPIAEAALVRQHRDGGSIQMRGFCQPARLAAMQVHAAGLRPACIVARVEQESTAPGERPVVVSGEPTGVGRVGEPQHFEFSGRVGVAMPGRREQCALLLGECPARQAGNQESAARPAAKSGGHSPHKKMVAEAGTLPSRDRQGGA